MSRTVLLTAATALALSGCSGGRGNESADAANAMPPGKTENGQLTARVQGVDLKIDLPPPIRRMTEDDDFLPPRSRTQRGGAGRRFHSDETPEGVVAWYRDGERADRFTITNVSRDGDAWVLAGTARGGGTLSVRLTPGADGGTEGTVVVSTER